MGHMTLHTTSCKEGLLFSEWAEKHKHFLVYQSETRTAAAVWNDVSRGSSTPAWKFSLCLFSWPNWLPLSLQGWYAPRKLQLAQLWFLVQQPMTGKSFALFCLKKAHSKVKPLDVILLYSHNDLAFLSQVRTSTGNHAFHFNLMVNNHRLIPSTYTHLTGDFNCSYGIQNIFLVFGKKEMWNVQIVLNIMESQGLVRFF